MQSQQKQLAESKALLHLSRHHVDIPASQRLILDQLTEIEHKVDSLTQTKYNKRQSAQSPPASDAFVKKLLHKLTDLLASNKGGRHLGKHLSHCKAVQMIQEFQRENASASGKEALESFFEILYPRIACSCDVGTQVGKLQA